MDTTLFLEQFGHLATSQDGVEKLRGLVLDLAVRGQLVEQNPDDEPVNQDKVRADKEKLVKENGYRNSKVSPTIEDHEIPFDAPVTWKWFRLGDILKVTSGDGLTSKQMHTNGTVPVYGGNGITGYHDKTNINEETLVIGRVGFYCGSVHVTENHAWITDNAFRTIFPRNHIYMDFLYWLLKATDLRQRDSATAQPVISGRKIYPIVVALPPLAEQKRIVARVDELMRLCDQLEAELDQQRELRERAVKSALFHLTGTENKSEALTYWRQAEAHFNALFDRPVTVAELRAAILQLAVQGRLVPQHPDDEPAANLLRQIKAERRNKWEKQTLLEYETKDRKPPKNWQKKYIQPDYPDVSELPELSQGWCWASLEQLSWDSSYGTSQKCDYKGGGSPVLRIPNISGGRLQLGDMKYTIKETDWDEKSSLESGDFLIIRTNGSSDIVGRGKLIRYDFNDPHYYASYLIRFRLIDHDGLPEWVELIWDSIQVREWITYIAKTTAGQFNVNMTNLSMTPIPIPPREERHKIVEQVNELMLLCDELEAEANHRGELASRLTDSVIYHLLNGHGAG